MEQTDKARLAWGLVNGWKKYHELFGDVPHGTYNQLSNLLELTTECKEFISLTEAIAVCSSNPPSGAYRQADDIERIFKAKRDSNI